MFKNLRNQLSLIPGVTFRVNDTYIFMLIGVVELFMLAVLAWLML